MAVSYNQKEKNISLRSGVVCAVGWEPNPVHTPTLTKLEEAFNRCGWKVGGDNHNTIMPIYTV